MALTPFLSDEQFPHTLVAARMIEDHGSRSKILATLASHQIGETKLALLQEALSTLLRGSSDKLLANTLMTALPDLLVKQQEIILGKWNIPFLQGL